LDQFYAHLCAFEKFSVPEKFSKKNFGLLMAKKREELQLKKANNKNIIDTEQGPQKNEKKNT
jgi:hypothetical protein